LMPPPKTCLARNERNLHPPTKSSLAIQRLAQHATELYLNLTKPPTPTWHTIWLELHTGEKTIFAETYLTGALSDSQFADALSTIKKNKLWYQSQGYEVILMGDYNVGMGAVVGDKTAGRNKARTAAFENFLMTAQICPQINAAQIKNNTHWTFNAHSGKSVNDYILTTNSGDNTVENYAAHPKLTCGSWHRLLTATTAKPHIKRSKPTKATQAYILWTKENTAKYKQHLKIELDKITTMRIKLPDRTKRDANKYAEDIAGAVTKAMESVANNSKGRIKDQNTALIKALSSSKTMKEACVEKNKLLTKAEQSKTPAERKKAWDAIGKSQKRIDKIQRTHQQERDQNFWEKLEINHRG
jgi:hypothetical protein